MLDAIALGELLIDFATVDTDRDGYPTLAAHPGGAPGNFLAALHASRARTHSSALTSWTFRCWTRRVCSTSAA